MRIAMAVLADAASVRENTISVLSAGITRLWRTDYPSPMDTALAVLLEIAPDDDASDIEISAKISGPAAASSGTIAEIRGRISVEPERTESFYVPVPLQLRGVPVPSPGTYEIALTVTSLDPVILTVEAVLAGPS